MTRRIALSALAVVTAGSILHFAWAWSGRSPIVAVFAAVNESTWEHLKLAFWPALALAPIQRRLYGPLPGWLPATAIRCLLPPVVIVGLFYGYTALLAAHYLPLDIGIFVIAVVLGEVAGHRVMPTPASTGLRVAAAAVVLAATVAFSTLSFRPPAWFLFDEPVPRPSVEGKG